MKIASHQLEAFFETAKSRSFSRAADRLGVTPSALSQRISNLEALLQTTLFVRDSSGPLLTEAGQVLLRYCQINSSLEEEVLQQISTSSDATSGVIRVAGFSSILRSVIIPSLAPFLRSNPDVQCEFSSYEVFELYDVLRSARADIVILDEHLNKTGIVEEVIGREEYVVIESTKYKSPSDLYLDHGTKDNATESFFATQPEPLRRAYRRTFMGDVYGILNGVELGLGRAVMSRHLIQRNKKIKILKGYRRYYRDITLHYYEQPFYSGLHVKVIKEIKQNSLCYL